jgi:cell filamentation protein
VQPISIDVDFLRRSAGRKFYKPIAKADDGCTRILPDPYCYPGTDILINRAELRDHATLQAFEVEMVTQRLQEPLPDGRFGVRHDCAIHRHLFQDVYVWAGKFRTVRIAKQGSAFCYPEHIDREMRRLFSELARQRHLHGLAPAAFAARAAHLLAELNAIHPFREGNGRAQMSFLVALASRAGHSLDQGRLEPTEMLRVMVRSFDGDEHSLSTLISRLME